MYPTLHVGLTWTLAALMLASSVNHVVNPSFYSGFIPASIPEPLANGIAAVAQLLVGLTLLHPATRALGGLAFATMMVAFLPLHVWDALKEQPAIGSKAVAIVRIVVQFGLIAAGSWVWRGDGLSP